MQDQVSAVEVAHISKDFVLPHEKVDTIKGLFTGVYKHKGQTKEVQHALKDISFDIKQGEFFGIVGRNGSGKSTLLKILAGIYQPTVGNVRIVGKLVPFIELGVGFNPELTGRENVYLNGAMFGFSNREVDAMYKDIVEFAELERFMDQKLKNYSSGMQVRLAFSMAIRAEADILLVDEVLAVGDADFQRKCFAYFKELKANKKTVVFVTHDMNAVREYCDRAILIDDNSIKKEGSSDVVATAYTRMFFEEERHTQKSSEKRWGSKEISIRKIEVSPANVRAADERLEIKMQLKVAKDVDEPIVGFLIKNQAGQALLGSNSQIERVRAGPFIKGSKYEVTWIVPNIFDKGLYYVDPAIIEAGNSSVFDWWEEAVSFNVQRETSTPYPVYPPLKLKIDRE